jgi:hypothetical protein
VEDATIRSPFRDITTTPETDMAYRATAKHVPWKKLKTED